MHVVWRGILPSAPPPLFSSGSRLSGLNYMPQRLVLGGWGRGQEKGEGKAKSFYIGFCSYDKKREFNEKPSPSPKCKITIITSCQVKAVSGQTSFNWASRRYRPILPFFIFPILFSPDSRTDSCKVNDIS